MAGREKSTSNLSCTPHQTWQFEYLKTACIVQGYEKKITITYYNEEYDRGIARVKSKKGRYMKAIRQSTVEPVFGSLMNYLGMQKMNTIGIRQAHKKMLMAAVAYPDPFGIT